MQNKTRFHNREKRKKYRFRKIALVISLFLIIILSISGYLAFQTISAAKESYTDLDRGSKSKLREEDVYLSKHPVSVLLMGIEDYSSQGSGGRADSLIVATFNPDSQSVKLVSLPRDTMTYIEDVGHEDKINHSFNYGQLATVETVENLLDIPIDYYATVNFDGFKSIIDEIGGVEVDVPFDFWEETDTYPKRKVYFYEGNQQLNGEEALAYARMRKRDPRGDFGRNDRQKELIKSSLDSLTKPSNMLKLDDIAEIVGDNIETNLKIGDGISFLKKYRNFNSNNIETLSLKGEDSYIDGVYYFIPAEESLTETKATLQNHLELSNIPVE
ncbi:LCP family protein [Mesobacillus jeotgali]|uniref:LCP family protein n=1 Tax=Mesobacillus jeotgali TaxID=129985 RepID=A0ABY9VII2_9BACI|nr:LCP family protein [Mesobacillus jeotgali]WNF22626.1 LCP family protein [Mesobacillus jeotgali]